VSDLLEQAIAAHGGLDRWNAFRNVSLDLSVGGALWDFKGQTGLFADAANEADIHRQRATLGRFGAPDRRVQFAPDRLVLETERGEVIEVRDNPRAAFAGHDNQSPWDRLHAAYFDGYALWTYLTQPFLYQLPRFYGEGDRALGGRWRNLAPAAGDIPRKHRQPYTGADQLFRAGRTPAPPRLRG
jgi:hypothetical protein